MLLQPLVENSIKQGCRRSSARAASPSAASAERPAVIDVIDNGVGVARSSTRARVAGPASDCGNVNERLRVIYGANYQLQLDSVPGEGTRARIVIPDLPSTRESGA